MARYTRESRDRVRDAVDFIELVSARTDLRRAGPARYEGLCPFHEERTPSFGIDPQQKVYHCFGCQASGDLFTFVQETEGVDFKQALELLAERTGVELQREEEDPAEAAKRSRRERLLSLLERTAGYYERYLWESGEAAPAREYLGARGLGEDALREFRVGFAPSAWDRVMSASRRGGFSEEELLSAGVAQRSRQRGQAFDRFRGRIMFPLCDVRGRVLGFGARAMGAEDRPKYLNSSDNEIYHKGLHLYGAHLARAEAARSGQVILCEGYTDAIALHQAGLRNAVGLMGTALTAEQVADLSRMAQRVLLALDADSAGQEAMLRAQTLAAGRRLELFVVTMPAGTDPAQLVQQGGPEAMLEAVAAAVPFVRFRVERVLAGGDDSTPEGRDRMLERLRPVFAALGPSAMRMELTRMVASRLALPESLVEQALPAHGSGGGRVSAAVRERRGGESPRAGAPAGPRSLSRREHTERAFLALCIASPEQGEQTLRELDVEEHFSGEVIRRAARHLRAGSLREPLAELPGEPSLEEDPALRALLAELIVQAGGEAVLPGMLDVQRLQLELARLDRDIQRARGTDLGQVAGLAERRGEVKREFDSAYARVLEATGAER